MKLQTVPGLEAPCRLDAFLFHHGGPSSSKPALVWLGSVPLWTLSTGPKQDATCPEGPETFQR